MESSGPIASIHSDQGAGPLEPRVLGAHAGVNYMGVCLVPTEHAGATPDRSQLVFTTPMEVD